MTDSPQIASNASTARIMPWLLVFLYVSFLYSYGAKLSTLLYTDFASFYYGARLAFIQKQSPYDEAALVALADRVEHRSPFEVRARVYPYLYPPSGLLIFYPLARLPLTTAKAALLVANHLSLLAVIAMLMIPIAGFTLRETCTLALPGFLIVYLIFSRGTVSTIELGQVNLIILALLCVAWWGIKDRWNALAIGVPLGLACLFKFYPILFIGLLAIRRRWGTIAATLLTIALASAASYVLLPHMLWHEWATRVLPSSGYLKSPMNVFPPTIAQNIGVAGFMARLFLPPRLAMEAGTPNPGHAIIPHEQLGRLLTVLLLTALSLATFAAIWISAQRQNDAKDARHNRLNLEFSAILLLTFLVAPLAWEHHLVYVTPAAMMAILLVSRSENASSRSVILVLATSCVLGWTLNVSKLPLPRVARILAVSAKLYAVLLLWGFLLATLVRKPSPVDQATTPALQS